LARGVPASRLRITQALRRSALKSIHWIDLTGFAGRASPEEWMAFFQDNDGRPLAIMSQAKTAPA